jgi:hypothetical protein
MTKAQLATLTLAESLFARAFAQNPDVEVEELITKCVRAAQTFDAALNELEKPKKAKKEAS